MGNNFQPFIKSFKISPITKAGSKDKGFESIREINILLGREPTKGTLEKGLFKKTK